MANLYAIILTILSVILLSLSAKSDRVEHPINKKLYLDSSNCEKLSAHFPTGEVITGIHYLNTASENKPANWMLNILMSESKDPIRSLSKDHTQITKEQFVELLREILAVEDCKPKNGFRAIRFDLGLVKDFWDTAIEDISESAKPDPSVAYPKEMTKSDVVKASIMNMGADIEICNEVGVSGHQCKKEYNLGVALYFRSEVFGMTWSSISEIEDVGLSPDSVVLIRLKN